MVARDLKRTKIGAHLGEHGGKLLLQLREARRLHLTGLQLLHLHSESVPRNLERRRHRRDIAVHRAYMHSKMLGCLHGVTGLLDAAGKLASGEIALIDRVAHGHSEGEKIL